MADESSSEIDAIRRAHIAKQRAGDSAPAPVVQLAPGQLDISDVTLVYISDAEDIAISSLAVRTNMAAARFGEVLLFSDVPWAMPGTRYVRCPPLRSDISDDPVHAIGAAMCVLWYNVPKYVKTKHFLIAQWDSWIINPARWTPKFLAYDYIGGPWERKKNGKSI